MPELGSLGSITADTEPINFTGPTNEDARFSPLVNEVGTVIPTFYTAKTMAAAACEIIMRNTGAKKATINSMRFTDHVWSDVSMDKEIKLLDLTAEGQRCIGLEQNALLAGRQNTYEETRR